MAIEQTLGRQLPESAPRQTSGELKRAVATVSLLTALSRVLGLMREALASSYFGTSGRFSAFTIAWQVPVLFKNLVADSALSAAFLPVFAELIEKGRKREAFELASTLLWGVVLLFSALVVVFAIAAAWVVPLFIGPTFSPTLVHLTVVLARLLFPMLIVLGANGLIVAILQTYGHFGLPAFGGAAWNIVTIALLIALRPLFHPGNQIYAYAIGVLAGTVVQFAIAVIGLRRIDGRLVCRINWRDARLRQVLVLLLPVSIALGIFDVDSLLNSTLGTLVSDEAPRAIAAAFQLSMVPFGLVAIPITSVLFPTMSRLAAAGQVSDLRHVIDVGLRRMALLIVPSAALLVALAEPTVRVIYQHGAFTAESSRLVVQALTWFGVSLPFAAGELFLTRVFFALRRPWIAAGIAAANVLIDIVVSIVLYKPLGIAGLVLGTVVASASIVGLQYYLLAHSTPVGSSREPVLRRVLMITACSGLSGVVAWTAAGLFGAAVGESSLAQLMVMIVAGGLGLAVYVIVVIALGVPEARDIALLVGRRIRRDGE